MDKLWAPWRSRYVKSKKNGGCVFCLSSKSKSDKKNYIITRNKYVFSILNIYPYNNGHIMAAPYRHIKDINSLNKNETLELMELINESVKLLKMVLKPDAFNIGINMGKAAGAGFASHLHVHILPRWQGDTNFMPLIAKTKVIPQSLSELYKRLKEANKKIYK